MDFAKDIYDKNKYRYSRRDLVVIMTVEDGDIRFFSSTDNHEVAFNPNSENATVFSNIEIATMVLNDIGLTEGHSYVIPLAALQILAGIDGGVSPTNPIYQLPTTS